MGLVGQIKIVDTKDTEASKKALNQQLGDISWAEGLPI